MKDLLLIMGAVVALFYTVYFLTGRWPMCLALTWKFGLLLSFAEQKNHWFMVRFSPKSFFSIQPAQV
jgi:hypothetical protein